MLAAENGLIYRKCLHDAIFSPVERKERRFGMIKRSAIEVR